MKTIKNIKRGLVLSLMIITAVGCSDFLEVNDSPNSPTISTPSLTLPVAQQSLVSMSATTMNYLGNYMTYSYSTPSNWSANSAFFRYTVSTTFYSGIFQSSYSSILKNLTYVMTYDDGVSDYSAYQTIAKVLKGYQFQYLVDLYGDVPYSEANLRGGNTTPKYDDAETVYKAIIEELTAAATLATNMPALAVNPGDQDIIFGGNMTKWAQFANTVKLRMLVRLSNTSQDAYITAEIAKINANGAGYITSTTAANPGYSDDASKQNPTWGSLGFAPNAGSLTDRNDYTVASDYMITVLTDNNDARIERLFAPAAASGNFKGAAQSTVLPGTGFTNRDVSHVGPGILVSATADQPIMLLSESLLIQAEAIARGYIPGGDAAAKTMYQNAIEASFTELGVTDPVTEAQAYYGQAGVVNVNWDDSPNKIEAIMEQKWVALCGVSAINSWIDKTRTGFPANLPVPAESAGTRPVRLLYPATEVARNSANVPAQATSDAFTSFPFWK